MGQSHRGENLSIYSNISALSMLVGEADPPQSRCLFPTDYGTPWGALLCGYVLNMLLRMSYTHTCTFALVGWGTAFGGFFYLESIQW